MHDAEKVMASHSLEALRGALQPPAADSSLGFEHGMVSFHGEQILCVLHGVPSCTCLPSRRPFLRFFCSSAVVPYSLQLSMQHLAAALICRLYSEPQADVLLCQGITEVLGALQALEVGLWARDCWALVFADAQNFRWVLSARI